MTLADLLPGAAAEAPDALAVVESDVQLTSGELERRARRFAAALTALGVGKGDVVTAQLPNWWETQVVTFGTLLVGDRTGGRDAGGGGELWSGARSCSWATSTPPRRGQPSTVTASAPATWCASTTAAR